MLDFLVVGGGISGASVACSLAARGRTLLLERESQPGYHATGRSAAVYAPCYGPAPVRALTRASRAFFEQAPAGFATQPLLQPRGALFVAEPGQAQALQALVSELSAESGPITRLSAAQACQRMPVLRPERVLGGVWDATVCDIDVNALHHGFLRGLRAAGGQWRCGAEVLALERVSDHWCVRTAAGDELRSRIVVNAAGAWCDELAVCAGLPPLGIVPKRRSAFVFAAAPGLAHTAWPLAIGVTEDWYLKPDAGQWLGSPANADPTQPQDVQPEELDIALGMHRIEQMTSLVVGRPQRTWAGLRSFFADGVPVAGYDPRSTGFFWLAGQGGYGIQTAPALGALAADLVCGKAVSQPMRRHGVREMDLAPQRLLRQGSPDRVRA